MTQQVVTRFAPSPTGFLHIGGARTALFNWLYAKSRGGKFLLRIEDTDRARSTDAAIDAILDGLKWFGIDWDGETVFQHDNAERHREVVADLLARGAAYKCYCTPDELTAMREAARAEGRAPIYDGQWRDRDPGDAPASVSPAIRFKSPRDGETVIDDQVQGQVTFANKDLDDLILLRSDGSPTYMLSVVVDDFDMGVTHVIRGDDHLTNAARQAQIFDALDWPRPVFAHVPLIHGPDGAKLSKRHGALGIEAYRAMGYLPAALRNYLVRLGWSHGDDEIFSTDQLLTWFDLDAIGRSPARFDFAKLESINAHYIRTLDGDELVEALKTTINDLDLTTVKPQQLSDQDWAQFELALPGLRERAKTLNGLIESAGFLFAKRPIQIDPKALKLLTDEARAILGGLIPNLQALPSWQTEAIDEAVRSYANDQDLKLAKVAQPLRAALTGSTVSPGIFDVLYALGQAEAVGRIADQAKPI